MSGMNNSSKLSKWPRKTLVVVPIMWKEINWNDRLNWPSWLREGLGLSNVNPRSYYIHLYQRIDPNSTYPYDWPYCKNVHEETGVFLQFVHDYYHDLPDKMLFMHGRPLVHTSHNPIQSAQCIRDDVHFASVNDDREWIYNRPWTYWPRDPDDNIALMYKCAKRILILLGYNAELQLNPTNKNPKDENVISGFCCAQFYVTKERIQRYTYEQWLSLFHANFEPYCTTPRENEQLGNGIQWFGGTFEHIWHVILGLYPVDAPAPKHNTTTHRCQWFRPACKGSPCSS
ncbi:unnamed protein product [Adineta steineri]|uniref:Uncharacterized protein n=2 Tax=Adineta steineri TaxID=433720 RepID=A0A813YWF2_9BILA|nr:unnamed protein product [Adineta steineri]